MLKLDTKFFNALLLGQMGSIDGKIHFPFLIIVAARRFESGSTFIRSVADPDPDWIRIQSGLWIRIQGLE